MIDTRDEAALVAALGARVANWAGTSCRIPAQRRGVPAMTTPADATAFTLLPRGAGILGTRQLGFCIAEEALGALAPKHWPAPR